MIEYKLDKDGGFFAHDTETGATAYAYPTSTHAVQARRNASKVANEMMRNLRPYMKLPIIAELAADLRQKMLAA